jgi:hypothetical protein
MNSYKIELELNEEVLKKKKIIKKYINLLNHYYNYIHLEIEKHLII